MNFSLFRVDRDLPPLSESEARTAKELALGSTKKEIANKYHKSEHTINNQTRASFLKTGSKNIADLTRWVVSRFSGKPEDIITNAMRDSLILLFAGFVTYALTTLA